MTDITESSSVPEAKIRDRLINAYELNSDVAKSYASVIGSYKMDGQSLVPLLNVDYMAAAISFRQHLSENGLKKLESINDLIAWRNKNTGKYDEALKDTIAKIEVPADTKNLEEHQLRVKSTIIRYLAKYITLANLQRDEFKV